MFGNAIPLHLCDSGSRSADPREVGNIYIILPNRISTDGDLFPDVDRLGILLLRHGHANRFRGSGTTRRTAYRYQLKWQYVTIFSKRSSLELLYLYLAAI